ncbi:glycosyltransferase family 2 protein [Mesonia mobilis]|uniref:Sugar transferase n=1 Tax=Mesonia mobilis TaxID=369791 RepID=A0ABQ3BWI9_9FLAO|nr:glycosyltransferase family 2 protein [Mesonia mobilis]MBQ0736951.1 glycosyltransferase family 2 protein [Aquimarina celericrescens]GGZ56850.1 sugar transferase [Mesonia mobilis]
MKSITVFTPTYNRAYLLPRLYESLCRQTCTDFLWLVIDDGSKDDTAQLIQSWKLDNKIEIHYVYKENGGMHTGHNLALKLINTELNVCIDSDDYLTDQAIEIVIDFWNKNKDEGLAGILGLNSYSNGKIVSSNLFPEEIKQGKYTQLKSKYNIVNDVKFVYSTKIIRKYPDYPTFENEKFVPLGYKYGLIDKKYDMLFLNKVLCIVEYMPDGSTLNMFKQYYKNPNGFSFSRKQSLKSIYTIKEKFILAIHLVAESILAKQNFFKDNNQKVLTALSLPFGLILYIFILIKK